MRARVGALKTLFRLADSESLKPELCNYTVGFKGSSTKFRTNQETKEARRVHNELQVLLKGLREINEKEKLEKDQLRENHALLMVEIKELQEINQELLQKKEELHSQHAIRQQMGIISERMINLSEDIDHAIKVCSELQTNLKLTEPVILSYSPEWKTRSMSMGVELEKKDSPVAATRGATGRRSVRGLTLNSFSRLHRSYQANMRYRF